MPDRSETEEEVRVSTIELFFDLVFVFTITQLTHLVDEAHGPVDFLRAFLVLMVIWWMYAGYAWLTNEAGVERLMRVILIAGMAGFLVIALTIPHLFGADGMTFGLAYLFVVLLHLAGFIIKGGAAAAAAILGIAPFNLAAAAFVIAAGIIDASWDWLFFLAAVLMFAAATFLRREQGFTLRTGHFAERHGLIIIIALGESVIAIGTGAGTLVLDIRTIAVVVLALILVAVLWWSYFDRDDEQAARALAAAAPTLRARIAVQGYGYAYPVMIAGIVLVATGIKELLAQGGGPLPNATWLLSAGIALYLLGDAAFRSLLRIGTWTTRGGCAVLSILVGYVSAGTSGVVTLLALTVLVAAMLLVESKFIALPVSPPAPPT